MIIGCRFPGILDANTLDCPTVPRAIDLDPLAATEDVAEGAIFTVMVVLAGCCGSFAVVQYLELEPVAELDVDVLDFSIMTMSRDCNNS